MPHIPQEQPKNEAARVEKAPVGWMVKSVLAQNTGVKYPAIERRAEQYRKEHPEWFGYYRAASGKLLEHYAPQLCIPIQNELSSVQYAQDGWMTGTALANELEATHSTIIRFIKRYRDTHPEWFRVNRSSKGRIDQHYAPELCDHIRTYWRSLEAAPDGWMTGHALSDMLGVSATFIQSRAEAKRQSHPEWFKIYKAISGRPCEHYSPQLCEYIQLVAKTHEKAPEKWMTASSLARELDTTHSTIISKVKVYRSTHPEWFDIFKDSMNKIEEHFSPELCEQIRKDLTITEQAPKGWMTKWVLGRELGVDTRAMVCKRADIYHTTHPEWFHEYKNTENIVVEHYSPQLCEIIRTEVESIQDAPEEWMTNRSLSSECDVTEYKVRNAAEAYRAQYPEWFREYACGKKRLREHYAPELCAQIRKIIMGVGDRHSSQEVIQEVGGEAIESLHSLLGRECEFNGVSFTLLGMNKEFYYSGEERVDCPLHTFSIARFRSSTLPLIPFQGGVACITKIHIADRVISGFRDIVDTLRESDNLPKVDSQTGRYIDSEGEEWMTALPLARLCGFSSHKVISRSGISSIAGIDGIGRKNTLYNVKEAETLFHGRNELPRVDLETGIYTDSEGREWMSPSKFSQDFDIPFRKVLSLMKDAPSIKGISNKVVLLYPIDMLLEICSQQHGLPVVDKETNIYTDLEDGIRWGSIKYFTDKYSLFADTVRRYFQIDAVPMRQGRERSGKQTNLFTIAAGESSLEKIASLPEADNDGYYQDASGVVWAPLGIIKKQYDIDVETIKNLIADIPSISCRDRSGNATIFYRHDHVDPCIEPYISHPCIDRALGYYQDPQGIRWAPIRYFRNKTGIGQTTFQSYAGHVKTIDGRAQGSGITKLYNIDEAEKALRLFFSLLAVDKETGMVQDEHEITWTTDNGFCAAHSVSYEKVHSMLDGVPTCEGRGANGMKSVLYRLDVLREKLKDFILLPVVDKQSGIYRDDSGKEYASLKKISDIIGVASKTLASYSFKILSIKGRDRSGEENTLYAVKEFQNALKDFLQLQKVDKSTGIYTDVEGKQWMPLRPLADRLGIGEAALKSLSPIARIRGRDKSGQEGDLLNIEDAQNDLRDFQILPLVHENGIYIDEDGIEWQQIDKAAVRFGVSRNFIERRRIVVRIGRTERNIRTKLCQVKDVEVLLDQRKK